MQTKLTPSSRIKPRVAAPKSGFCFDIDQMAPKESTASPKIYPHSCRNADRVGKLEIIPKYTKLESISNISEQSEGSDSGTCKNISRSNARKSNLLLFPFGSGSKCSQDVKSFASSGEQRLKIERMMLDQKFKTDHYKSILKDKDEKISELKDIIDELHKQIFDLTSCVEEYRGTSPNGLVNKSEVKANDTADPEELPLLPQLTIVDLASFTYGSKQSYKENIANGDKCRNINVKTITDSVKEDNDLFSPSDSVKLKMIMDITKPDPRASTKSKFITNKSSFNYKECGSFTNKRRITLKEPEKHPKNTTLNFAKVSTEKATDRIFFQNSNINSVKNNIKQTIDFRPHKAVR